MSRRAHRSLCLAACVLALAALSCSVFSYDQQYSVRNLSSYAITMTDIQNADRSELIDIRPGESRTISFRMNLVMDTSIAYQYSPSDKAVATVDRDRRTITFADR